MALAMGQREVAFWDRVRIGDGCWEWTGALNEKGYARLGGRRANRIAWELTNGPAGEKHVLHRCDNRKCVRPGHLFLGTHADNMADMVAKGRGRNNPAHGEKVATSRLTVEAVREIRHRSATETQSSLAREFGVHVVTVSDLVRGKTWKGVR